MKVGSSPMKLKRFANLCFIVAHYFLDFMINIPVTVCEIMNIEEVKTNLLKVTENEHDVQVSSSHITNIWG